MIDIDYDNLDATYEKNKGNLIDSLQFGCLLQKTQALEDSIDSFGEYTAEEKRAIGFSTAVSSDKIEEIRNDTVETHMPTGSYKEYESLLADLYRANQRAVLADEATYRQVLDSIPEDEPYREDKATYLFNESTLNDHSSDEYLSGVKEYATGHMLSSVGDILDGENHGGDAKAVTIGEVLDGLGFSAAEKSRFISEYKFKSAEETLYDHQISTFMQPGEAEKLGDNRIISFAGRFLRGCLENHAEQAVAPMTDAELTQDQREYIQAYRKRKKEGDKVPRKGDTKGLAKKAEVDRWFKEKGEHLSRELFKAKSATEMLRLRTVLEGGGSLKDISANAPYEDSIRKRKEESYYISEIIHGRMTADDVAGGVIAKGRGLLPIRRQSAEAFINDIRRGFRDETISSTAEDYPKRQFADIFAARILSDSVRGKRASLSGVVSSPDLRAMSDQLMKNRDFDQFIKSAYFDENGEPGAKLEDTVRRLYTSRTHGGFIEDEFKKYLLKREPGKLNNSPELARFMPTAEERIDELKRQVKSRPGDRDLQEAAAAEIIAIRNACRVERGTKYGLDKQIPAAPEGQRLGDEVQTMLRDGECKAILGDSSTRALLLSRGHGGMMTINLRKRYNEQVRQESKKPETETVLNKNTVGRHLAELREEAKALRERIADKNGLIRGSAMERSKEVLGEYMALLGRPMDRRGDDAPWKTVDALRKNTVKDPVAQRMMETPEKASEMMEAIASGDPDLFRSTLAQKMNAARTAAAPEATVSRQPVRGPEGPQDPTV